jgi:hypothetical protein
LDCSFERFEGSIWWFKAKCVFDEEKRVMNMMGPYARDMEHVLVTLPI